MTLLLLSPALALAQDGTREGVEVGGNSVFSRLVPADTVTALAETFRALGDPSRVRILDVLSHGELCVCDLAAVLSTKGRRL